METERLRYFCMIAETGSLTKASEILNISHSGLSKAMSVLQSELDQTLFRPQGRGLELTEDGKTLYRKSKDLLVMIEGLKQNLAVVKEPGLRIGMTEVFSLALTREFSKALSMDLDVYDLDSGEMEVKLLDGQMDFAVTTVPFPHPQLEYLKVTKAGMGIYFVNSRFQNLSVSEIPFVGPNSEMKNNPLSIRSRDGWPEKLPRHLSFGASSLATALGIVDAGEAAVFIPQFVAKALNEVRSKEFHLQRYKQEPSSFRSSNRDVYLVKKKNQDETPEMKVVAKILRVWC